MQDEPIDAPDCTYETIPIDTTLAAKGTYSQVPIFTHWLPYLGQIAFLWGAFEGRWNTFLEAMFAATGTLPPPKWRKRKGKDRYQMFLSQVDATFDKQSGLNEYLHELVRDSIAIQQKRNVLLHGNVWLMMGPDPYMVVEGTSNDGQPERHEYRETDIKVLFYELSHLVGRFTLIFHPETETAKSSPLPDRHLVQELWRKARQNLPTAEAH